jgi:hypothetical protein
VLHHHLVVHGIEIGKGMRDADYGSPIPMETGSTSASSCSW